MQLYYLNTVLWAQLLCSPWTPGSVSSTQGACQVLPGFFLALWPGNSLKMVNLDILELTSFFFSPISSHYPPLPKIQYLEKHCFIHFAQLFVSLRRLDPAFVTHWSYLVGRNKNFSKTDILKNWHSPHVAFSRHGVRAILTTESGWNLYIFQNCKLKTTLYSWGNP